MRVGRRALMRDMRPMRWLSGRKPSMMLGRTVRFPGTGYCAQACKQVSKINSCFCAAQATCQLHGRANMEELAGIMHIDPNKPQGVHGQRQRWNRSTPRPCTCS